MVFAAHHSLKGAGPPPPGRHNGFEVQLEVRHNQMMVFHIRSWEGYYWEEEEGAGPL